MIQLALVVWLLGATQGTWSPKSELCSQLPGRWEGLIEAPEHSYSWTAETRRDGSFAADFMTIYADGSRSHSSQRGTWSCKDGVFTTDAALSTGQRVIFRYQILKIDGNHMVYRILWGDEQGTVFGSTRVK